MTKLLTTAYATYLAEQVYESLVEEANTSFYVYTGVHGDVIGEIPVPADDQRELVVDSYRNMIFGKRVKYPDASLVVRYVPYESKVFAMYDDNDDDLLEKDFYCMVDEDSFVHVYKCLNNNFGAVSTVEPVYTYVSSDSKYVFETSDGYVWQYMYSVSDTTADKFSTQNYFPVVTNANVAAAATRGAVDVIRIEQTDLEIPGGGKKYDNYVTGTFGAGQLRVNGNSFLYSISNTNISYTAGFYTGCLLYLSSGPGAGQYSLITDYYHNSNGNFIGIASEFPELPDNGTTFEIYPSVSIRGSGKETVTAIARALVNSTGSNSIYKIEMMEKGAGYDYISANVVASGTVSSDVGFVEAELHPIYSPSEGHGVNSGEELGARAIEFCVKFANSEANTILTNNRYQQIGLLKDPHFSNVIIRTTNAVGTFHANERLYKIQPKRVNANVNITNTSPIITGETSTLASASIIATGTGGQYIPTDILTIEGGVPITAAKIKVLSTEVVAATINAAGSGYALSSSFNANLNLGTATTNAIFNITTNATGFCTGVTVTNPGVYTANPPFLANSTPVGGTGSGVTLNIRMGLDAIEIYNAGAYAVIPTDLATNNPISNIGTGAGASLLIAFNSTLTADFSGQFSVGDYVYLTNVEKTAQQLAVVNSITNATYMDITVNGFFSCTMAMMYDPRKTASADVVVSSNATHLVITDVDHEFSTGDLVVGEDSGAKAQVNTVTRNGVQKTFDSFVQLYKYDVTLLSGEFIENESAYQGTSVTNATATALIHSLEGTGPARILYTSNQVGQFVNTSFIVGVNSLAVASLTDSFSPELEFGSGDVLYVENVDPVNRAPDQSETFQIVLTF